MRRKIESDFKLNSNNKAYICKYNGKALFIKKLKNKKKDRIENELDQLV